MFEHFRSFSSFSSPILMIQKPAIQSFPVHVRYHARFRFPPIKQIKAHAEDGNQGSFETFRYEASKEYQDPENLTSSLI